MAVNQELLVLIDAFIENELALAGYYRACMEAYPDNIEKWQILSREEDFHAEVFRKIRASAEEQPSQWRMGTFFAQTVKLVCKSVKDKTEELKQGKLNPRYAVNFIADVEQSLIESNISKSFTTDLPEFQTLLERVQTETVGHKQLLLSLRA